MAAAAAFNIEGAIRIRTGEAKAALAEFRTDLATTTTAAKKVAAETANVAKAPLAVLNRPAPVDFAAQFAGSGAAAAQSQTAFSAAVAGANRSIAEQSAAFARARMEAVEYRAQVEAVRAQFVPAAATAQRFQKELLAISAAEEMGALSAKEAAAARKQAAAGLEAMDRAAGSAAGGIRGLGMQLNQVATVGGMTGDWMSAIAIQLPDILMAFGTVGIFAGVAAGALMPFIAGLMDGADKAKVLKESLEGLEASADAWRSALDRSMTPMAELQDRFGRNADAARELFDRLLALEQLEFADKLAAHTKTLVGTFDGVRASVERIDAAAATTGANSALAMEAIFTETSRLKDEFGLTVEEARGIGAAMDALDSAKGPAQIVPAAQALYDAIAATAEAGGAIDPNLRDAARAALDTALQAAELEAKLGISVEKAREIAGIDMASGIQAASEEARQLAAFLGVSLERANAIASGGKPAASRLGFGLSPTADPVYGGAKGLTFGPDPGAGGTRDGIIDLTVPEIKKGRGGKSDAEKAADKAERERERDARQVADYIAGAQAEIDALHELDPVQQEIIRNRRILDKASPEQRALIELQIEQRVATESLRDAWAATGDVIYDALEGMVLQGETAGEVMESLTRSVAQLLLRAALLGDGPLAGILGFGGGGLIGTGISAIMGSFGGGAAAATGGTVTPFLDLLSPFDAGGWTGGADPSTVVGLVHGQEYVFDAEATKAIGVKNLDAMRRAARHGYRDGGFALASGPAPATGGSWSAPSATAPREIIANFHISVSGTGNAEIAAATRAGIEQALDSYDRHVLPMRVGQITSDPRSIG